MVKLLSIEKMSIFILYSLNYEILATYDLITFEVSWKNILKILKSGSTDIEILSKMNKLKSNHFFQQLSATNSSIITYSIKKEIYQSEDIIFVENSEPDYLYLIGSGRLKVTIQGKQIRILEERDFFGEIAILKNNKRTASVTALTECELYLIHKDSLGVVLDRNITDFLQKRIELRNSSLELDQLYYISFLGKGKFGSVCLVHDKKSFYAVKSINRRQTEFKQSLSGYVKAEKQILQSINHPFIIKFVKTLKNEFWFFYVLEYVHGLILEEYLLQRLNTRNASETRFYIASLLLTIDYLNKKCITHRDVKPNNIMIDMNGFIKLFDFGTAKYIKGPTYTIIGTPHYIAPEILNGKGYTFQADYWSIGIIMFEIFYGSYPFGNNKSDIMEIYKDILYK
jgi:cGMP-dependent protein kinase